MIYHFKQQIMILNFIVGFVFGLTFALIALLIVAWCKAQEYKGNNSSTSGWDKDEKNGGIDNPYENKNFN